MTSARPIVAVTILSIPACDAGPEGRQLPDPETLALGRSIYAQHCAACHGATGEGAPDWQQMNQAGEMPAPPHDSTGHTWRHSDGVLYRIIEQGWRDPFNRAKRLTMPAFRNILTPAEIRAVIGYLKTLWTPEQRRFQLEES